MKIFGYVVASLGLIYLGFVLGWSYYGGKIADMRRVVRECIADLDGVIEQGS